jgi:WD40 repeat protein
LPGHGVPINAKSWSPDGVWLATAAHGDGIKIWNTHTGALKKFGADPEADTHHPDAAEVGRLAWAPDSQRLAVSYTWWHKLWIIDTDTGDNTPRPDPDQTAGFSFDQNIREIAWSQDSTMMAVSLDNDILLLNPQTFEITGSLIGHSRKVYDLAWGPDGQLASCGLDKTVRLWNTKTGQPIRSFRGHEAFLYAVAWNPEGTRLLSNGFPDGAKIWDVNAKMFAIAPPSPKLNGRAVAWGPDSRRLVFSDADHALIVWDTDAGKEVARFTGHQDEDEGEIRSLTWSRDGARIASCTRSKSLRIWDTKTGDELKNIESDTNSNLSSVAWSPDGGRLLIGAVNGAIEMWDTETFDKVGEFLGHEQRVRNIAWSPDGQRIVSESSAGRTVRVWDVRTRKQTHQINDRSKSIAWSPDGQQLATVVNISSPISIWDVGTTGDGVVIVDKPTTTLEGHTGFVNHVSWNAEFDRLASTSVDGSAKVWDVAAGKSTITFTHPELGPLASGVWSPDGQRLLTISEAGDFEIWDASRGYTEERLRVVNETAAASDPVSTSDPTQ